MNTKSITRTVVLPLLILTAMFVATGCDELFYVSTDGKIKYTEKGFKVLYGGERLVLHGLSFLGKDRENSSATIRYQNGLQMGYDLRFDLGILSSKKTAGDFSYVAAGVEVSGTSDITFMGLQTYPNLDGWQGFMATQDGVIPNTTFQISTSGKDVNLVNVRFLTEMDASSQTWTLKVYANAFGDPEGSPRFTQTGIPNMGWTYQPAISAVGMERGSDAFAGFRISHAGHLPSAATDFEEINYNFAKGYGLTLEAQYKTDHWPRFSSSWSSLVTQDLQNFEQEAEETQRLIAAKYQISFKKSPQEKALKLIEKAIKASEKTRKKIGKGAKPKSVWKGAKKARDQFLKAQNLIRELGS